MKLFGSILLSSALSATFVTALPDPVQTYFVPLPDNDLMNLFKTISAGLLDPANVTNPNQLSSVKAVGNVNTVISIAIAANNTVVYYDHWEDGFESDAKLRTQLSTQIWGDGDLSNGIAPGTTNDIMRGGMAIVLRNNVKVNPRDPTQVFYDGSDRIQSSLPIAVTRFAYPDTPGSLMAGAVEVFSTSSWGRRFIAPVGTNTPDVTLTNPFEYTRFFVMAGEDNTEVFRNNVSVAGVFNKGNSIDFSVQEGDVITSDRPIQVDLIGADVNDNYELRWYAQVDANDWTDEYISPVAETQGNTGFWFYNPHDYPLTISYNGGNLVSGQFIVNAKSSKEISCVNINSTATDVIKIGPADFVKSVSSAQQFVVQTNSIYISRFSMCGSHNFMRTELFALFAILWNL